VGAARSGFGELVQWDTPEHDWLEGRGAVPLPGENDRRRHQLSWGRFVESDATPQNMGVLWEYLENGRMIDVHTDCASMSLWRRGSIAPKVHLIFYRTTIRAVKTLRSGPKFRRTAAKANT
jgi:hypothetical protein